MAYLTISTAFNIEASGVTIDGTKCTNLYSLDLIQGPVRIKFNKPIYSTYNNGTQQIFIPANTYVNMAKDTGGLAISYPSRYVYSARTTTSVSNYSFPTQTVNYNINIPDLTKTITVTGVTNVGSLATHSVRLSATTSMAITAIAHPTFVRTAIFNSAITFSNKSRFYVTTGDTEPSGFQIYETRHLSNYSASTYLYTREMQPYMPYLKENYNSIYFFSPYSGSTFEIHRMGEKLTSINRTYKDGSLTGTNATLITHQTLSGGTKSTVLTNKLFKTAYPRVDESSFNFAWTNSDDGEVFTVKRAQDFVTSVESNQLRALLYSEPDSTTWAVRCNELIGTSRCLIPATAQYGSVINTEDAFISISSAYTTTTFKGNLWGYVVIPFLTGLGNTISLEFSGNSLNVHQYLEDNCCIENGLIYLEMTNSINEDSTTYMTVEAYSPKYRKSSATKVTIYTEEQSCNNCDNCNDSSSCQYT